MRLKLFFLVLASFVFLAAFSFFKVWAQSNECQQIYGGGLICPRGEVLVDKMVRNPQSGTFVDNLGINDPRFSPEQEVVFRLILKNPGTATLSKMEVKDIFPNFLDFLAGPGTFDTVSKTLTFTAENLAPQESRQFEVKAKVVPSQNFPQNQSLLCVVNTAEVRGDDRFDRDTTQLCLEKKVLGAEVIPVTGPKHWVFAISGSLFFLILSLFLFQKSRLIKN